MKFMPLKMHTVARWVAAGLLPVWLLAVAHCSLECSAGDSDSYSKAEPGHSTAGPVTPLRDSDKQGSDDDSFCVSLHTLCPTTSPSILVKPDFGLAFTLDFISPAQLLAATQPETTVSRQPPDLNRIFTPEVCLGPAFHSLAPPSLV